MWKTKNSDLQEKDMEMKRTKIETVLHILTKQSPLSLKQEKYCNNQCVERFLKAKGDNPNKAAKHLRACLSWRHSISVENLIADEFSGELAEGVAYVAGHDEESRPVMVFRIKQDYHKFHSHKFLTRLIVFTLEVAIQTMPRNTEQFVILFDASASRSASGFLNMMVSTMKMVGEYYPGRLHKAFVIDPPSLFPYLWKGVRPFIELSKLTAIVSSSDFEHSVSLDYHDFSIYPRAASLRFNPAHSSAKVGSCSSSRFSFTVSHNYDSFKPWYLSLTDTPSFKVGPDISSTSSILGQKARSFSFASPIAHGPHALGTNKLLRKNFIPSTPLPQKSHNADVAGVTQPWTPKPSFLHSRRHSVSKGEKSREAFFQYFKLYRRPYDEMIYRSKMRSPLGGLVSIVPPQLRRRHFSVSERF